MKLVTLLSSYPAVVEALGQQSLPNKDSYTFREVPESILVRGLLFSTISNVFQLFFAFLYVGFIVFYYW
jgi:hypothetical protein